MDQDEVQRILDLLDQAIHLSRRSRREIERTLGLGQGYLGSLLKGRIELKVRHVYVLARELGLCYTGIALVTDYDTGIAQGREPVSIEEVFRVFKENIGKVRDLINAVVPELAGERVCECEELARQAVVG